MGRITNTCAEYKRVIWRLMGLATKWRWMACVGRSRQGVRYIVSTCQSSCGNKSETNAIAEWRDKNRKRGEKREGDVFKTSLNRCTFTVTQRNKWNPLKGELCFTKGPEQRNQQFCDSSFEGFLLFGVECWGVCGALAAEAIWVSSTSKVGQLVPVPLLMCWRGALCGGLRARLKGLRSLLGGGGVNMTNKGGGQDLRAMWKLYLVHWPLRACTGPAAILLANKWRERLLQFLPFTAATTRRASKNERLSKTEFVDTPHVYSQII